MMFPVGVRAIHGSGHLAVDQHVNCHDGKHLSDGGRDAERMAETGKR